MKINRIKSESLHTSLEPTASIAIAEDNLVCAICKQDFVCYVVSHPKQKGVIVFACYDHVEQAKDLLSKLL